MTLSSSRPNAPTRHAPADHGLQRHAVAESELLIDGQEEVFSRSEVELGRIEHHTASGGKPQPAPSAPDPEDLG